MRAWLLGSGGWIPTGRRETTCVLVRDDRHALVLDAGTGFRRLITEPELLDGVETLQIALTHFHLDHVCGLSYTPALPLAPTIWAPGAWLYGRPSAELLRPLRTAPISAFDGDELGPVLELGPGPQIVGPFAVTAREQHHWAPTAGLRVGDALALLTDTGYDPASGRFAAGVTHLLHEAWTTSDDPRATPEDATAAGAAQVALEARVGHLTLMHLDPRLSDESALLADARSSWPRASLGEDATALQL